ncbi:lipopolysaccharide assembly protein LapA domain-containing protein [Litorilituus lipolyticus]|uniref:lipopolysaccharide assembly protein LapA domain-containing protein n=1 Tax=Litorilituus lipolyticus TaxID=2491017 RepID=UPI001FEBD696|nr:lipopolysaccharide assembly protein LapA domain-containing protein [Litorilituus lipolyticus]
MRLYITLFLLLFFILIAFIFGSQNDQIITLNYLIARSEITVAEAVSIFSALGFIIGILVTIVWRLVRKGKKALSTPQQ